MQYINLGKLVELKQGMAINSKSNHLVSKEETSLPLLRIADMPTRAKNVFMKEETPKRFVAEEDDIIYTRTGQVGLVFRKQHGVVHNNCFRVYPIDKSVLDKDYLYWGLKTKSIYNFANSIAGGSAQPDLPHTTFKKIKFPFVDIEKQRKIAKILNKYEDILEINTKRISLLEEEIEELYKEWFIRRKCQSKIIKLGEIISFTRGLSYTSEQIQGEEGNNLINLGNIKPYGGFDISGIKKYSGEYKKQQIVQDGDLVMGITDMTQDRRTVGSVALINNVKGINVISSDLIIINSEINKNYLYCLFKYGGISKHISQYANGTNVLHLRPDDVLKIKINFPSNDVIIDFSNFISPILKKISLLNLENEMLISQKDLLLPRLLSGKLEVK